MDLLLYLVLSLGDDEILKRSREWTERDSGIG